MDGWNITKKEFAKVLKNRMEIEEDEGLALAEFILDIFGYEDRVIDNLLGPSDRQIFYFLEGKSILSTGRETISLHDGRDWRIHYWVFNRERVGNFIEQDKVKEERNETMDIYTTLPSEAWVR